MSLTDLKATAEQLPHPWKSTVVARIGGSTVKVLRMDGSEYPEECHTYPEGLLVLDGQCNLTVEGNSINVRAGEIYIVPPGVRHSVAPGSSGTLVIFDV
jgi:quercetin dioxygenase-like cupin family protein